MSLAPILFATSNVAKFLQARLVLGWSSFEVHRLESHRSSYAEPYGLPRFDFLNAGLTEVLARAGSKRLVFVEDTTANFPSLGPDGTEYPGQQTKEWFIDTSHRQLMKQLDAADGDRTVIVRSDILLHLPGHTPILFSATTHGTVVERVRHVPPNDLYPWLGRRDFSSWFVPTGASDVLAAMPLEESVRYDFRAKALRKLAARLGEYRAAANLPPPSIRRPRVAPDVVPHQPTLFDNDTGEALLIVIGPIASGKTTVGHHLELHRGFRHIEGSRMLLEAASRFGMPGSSSNFDLADELFERFGFDVVEREIVVPTLLDVDGPVVYTGCRTIEGMATMRDAAHELNRPVMVVFISTPANLRLSRAVDRARIDGTLDAVRFDDASARDEAYGAVNLGKNLCDAHITNKGDMKSLLTKVDSLIQWPGSVRATLHSSRTRTAKLLAECRSRVEAAAVLRALSPDLVSDADGSTISARGLAVARLLGVDPDTVSGAGGDGR
jgi:XTP/dITP diphosphohydrolase